MYRHCIHCSADLGANEVLEAFPVGSRLAFDAAKGRLWAVCPKCARWNLSPIEERWEAVEVAERIFADSRLRVQSENVGMAKARDGTRLIRVGAALPGELAAWRYGDQLLRRRRGYLLAAGTAMAAGLAVVGGAAAAGAGIGAAMGLFNLLGPVEKWWRRRVDRRVVYRLPSSDGNTLLLRRVHARAAVLRAAPGGGGIELEIPDFWSADPPIETVLNDSEARAFLRRGMVHVNEKGGSRRDLDLAVGLLLQAGASSEFLARVGGQGRPLAPRADMPGRHLNPSSALAVEMALHEEEERRAMQGELTLLEAAWREAEEIAGIADRLALEGTAAAGRPEPA